MRHKIVVMGVSGSGKATLARELAVALEGAFIEGDEHHFADRIQHSLALHSSQSVRWHQLCSRGCGSNDKNGKSQPRSKMADDSKKEMVEIQPVTCTRNFSDYERIPSA